MTKSYLFKRYGTSQLSCVALPIFQHGLDWHCLGKTQSEKNSSGAEGVVDWLIAYTSKNNHRYPI